MRAHVSRNYNYYRRQGNLFRPNRYTSKGRDRKLIFFMLLFGLSFVSGLLFLTTHR